jgi:hypothetical protein
LIRAGIDYSRNHFLLLVLDFLNSARSARYRVALGQFAKQRCALFDDGNAVRLQDIERGPFPVIIVVRKFVAQRDDFAQAIRELGLLILRKVYMLSPELLFNKSGLWRFRDEIRQITENGRYAPEREAV